MKNTILLLSVFFLASCEQPNEKYLDFMPYGDRVVKTVIYEGCEYIVVKRMGEISVTHKGNCMFCKKDTIK